MFHVKKNKFPPEEDLNKPVNLEFLNTPLQCESHPDLSQAIIDSITFLIFVCNMIFIFSMRLSKLPQTF